MRSVPPAMTTAWKAQLKGGDAAPTVRATIQRAELHKFDYDTALAPGGDNNFVNDRSRAGIFSSIIFGDASPLRELRNIKSFTWSRSLDQDIAQATLVLLNSEITPIGAAGQGDDFDQPGYFTYNRGDNTNPWGYGDNGWNGIIVPDRIIKTYEGYGRDDTQPPGLDENLLQSGTWLVDTVEYTHDGEIRIGMRDIGRLLTDMIVFPPVVPYSEYPMLWTKIKSENVPGRDAAGGAWDVPAGTCTSSNNKYIGKGLTDPPYDSYVQSNGGFNGHLASHALTEDDVDKYWLSTGQTTQDSRVWWEIDLDNKGRALAGVRLDPKGGPYRVYVSVKTSDGWMGKKKIPYDVTTGGVDIDADIPFVTSAQADRGRTFDIILPRKYANVQKVRLTFTRLWDTMIGDYPWRAGINKLKLYTAADAADLSFTKGQVLKVTGNYSDYSQIIKWVTAWAGWFWPPHSTGLDFIRVGDGIDQTITYAGADSVLPKGKVWGDFMRTGTAGKVDLTPDLFDKQPLMDVINYVRDAVGFLFFIDETGAVVWRHPNLWESGNYMSPGQLAERVRSRTTDFVTIDEEETLLGYGYTLDSGDVRERIFVANSNGKFGTVIKGYVPYKVGFRRVAGWTDQNFEDKTEVKVMADLIAAQQMFNYRRSKITIPAYPAIQIDDQVKVLERVTNETYRHYVLGITSTFEAETGQWTYDLDTHWLGEHPSDAWAVKVTELDNVTQAYLNTIGEDG